MSATDRILITFPEPIELTAADQCAISEVVSAICKRWVAAHPGRVMWPFGFGALITSMPITAEDDANGVRMEFDETTFHVEVSERADYQWPCGRCGRPQGDHRDHIIDPPAGDCEFKAKT